MTTEMKDEKKERTIRVSPAGVITVTTAMRRVLGVEKREAFTASITSEHGRVRLATAHQDDPLAVRVSRGGVAQLPRDAFLALTAGKKGRCKLDFAERVVSMRT